ncbi:hypothetical protein RQP46_008109 [Phenoliferia psychrophenolica]
MTASITDQLQHLELAPIVPPSHAESKSSGEAKTTSTLPPELISEIIYLTVEILVEEERHLASQVPLTNHFLLSAALVSRTWHSIASQALLESGLVTPKNAYKFLDEIKRRELNGTLERLRFGAGSAGLDRRPLAPGEISDDRIFQALVNSLKGLQIVELVGIGLRFSDNEQLDFKYQEFELIFSNTHGTNTSMYLKKLDNSSRPARLSIIETRGCDGGNWSDESLALNYLATIPHLSIYSNQLHKFPEETYLGFMIHLGTAFAKAGHTPCLRSFRLESSRKRPWVAAEPYDHYQDVTTAHFPSLSSLSTHLGPLHLLATNGNRPSLTSLEVLPDGGDDASVTNIEKTEEKMVEVIEFLPILRTLKVPACWRSEAVEVACEAKGVALRWT